MHILIDQDSVIADWDAGYDNLLDQLGSAGRNIPRRHQRTVFNLHAGLGPRQSLYVRRIMDTPGFYAQLPVIEGATLALNEIAEEHDVSIVTSPWNTNPTCASDKLDWLERNIGEGWADRAILTKDKTMVRGDVLIDDKPDIKGIYLPTWTQIIYTAPYNLGIDGPRITDWSNWREVVDAF